MISVSYTHLDVYKRQVLACVVGMILSLVFYVLDYFKLTNDQ